METQTAAQQIGKRLGLALASIAMVAASMMGAVSPASAQTPAAAKAPTTAAAPATPTAAEESVRKRFIERFDGAEIDSVTHTPYGLYELRLGSQLIYTDEAVSYVLQGNLIDVATRRNVTKERIDALMAVRFKDLPLDLAIKQVRGNGARKVALFEDPNCGYCKQLRQSMEGVDNVTIYTFLYPILSEDSMTKAKNILCSATPGKVWDDWMLKGRTPARTAGCDTSPIDRTLTFGQSIQVRGTPTIIFSDDTRVGGAIPADQFKAKLDSLPKS
ncbi:DsbC family protein [Pigmentiphaga aceris]|uniref:Thiol:disulfide interchange protein n=2 Tax=Pigmentiphaga aceris TaxID=1940612 RepID=A0A5C0B5C8_9BURK|nr:DsbC family protein [Pigmentiphaga aceris]